MAFLTSSYNGGKYGSVTQGFVRGPDSLGHYGETHTGNNRRFGRSIGLLSSSPVWTQAWTGSPGAVDILATGYDHDGVTPLTIAYDTNQQKILIFRDDYSDMSTNFEYSFQIFRSYGPANIPDMLKGTTLQEDDYVYAPVVAAIHNGLITVLCQRERLTEVATSARGKPDQIAVVTMQASSVTATDWMTGPQMTVKVLPLLGGDTTWNSFPRVSLWAGMNIFDCGQGALGGFYPVVDYLHSGTSVTINLTAATFDVSELTLTETDAFEYYRFNPNDVINITGASNITPGAYRIASWVDKDSVIMEADITNDGLDSTAVTASTVVKYPGGGQVGLLGFTRPAVGEQWVVGEMKLCLDTILDSIRTPVALKNQHIHSAACVMANADRMLILVDFGDSNDYNETIMLQLDATDVVTNYASATVTIHRAVHSSVTATNPGSVGAQKLTMCAHPTESNMLVCGMDIAGEMFNTIEIDVDNPSAKIDVTRMTSPSPSMVGDGTGGQVSSQGNVRALVGPDGKTQRMSFQMIPSNNNAGDDVDEAVRVGYSVDGYRIVTTGILELGDTNGTNGIIPPSPGTTAFRQIHGTSSAIKNVYICDLPDVQIVRPLIVQKGDAQCGMQITSPLSLEVAETDTTNEAACEWLTKNSDGLWEHNGVALSPQPPCYGPVRYVELVAEPSPDMRLGTYQLSGNAAATALITTGGIVGARCWIMAIDDGVSLFLKLEDRNNALEGDGVAPHVVSNKSWYPIVKYDDAQEGSTPGNYNVALEVISLTTATPQKFYIAFDNVVLNDDLPGYPQPFGDAASPAIVSAVPDELISDSAFTCTEDFTFSAVLKVPDDGWDSSFGVAVDGEVITTQYLCTLYRSGADYVEFFVTLTMSAAGDITTSKISHKSRVGSTDTTKDIASVYFRPGDIIKLVYSHDTTNLESRFTVQVAAPIMGTTDATVKYVEDLAADAWSSTQPNLIKTGNNDGTVGGNIEVIRFNIDVDNALTEAQQKTHITSGEIMGTDVTPSSLYGVSGSGYTGNAGKFYG